MRPGVHVARHDTAAGFYESTRANRNPLGKSAGRTDADIIPVITGCTPLPGAAIH
jgi:hypothetical protein